MQKTIFDHNTDIPETVLPEGHPKIAFSRGARWRTEGGDQRPLSEGELGFVRTQMLGLGYSTRLVDHTIETSRLMGGFWPRGLCISSELFSLWWNKIVGDREVDRKDPEHIKRWNWVHSECQRTVDVCLPVSSLPQILPADTSQLEAGIKSMAAEMKAAQDAGADDRCRELTSSIKRSISEWHDKKSQLSEQ